MKVHKKSSVAPIYLLGLTWLVYALLFPLHAPVHFVNCAVVSLVVFAAGKALFPDQVYQLPGEEQETVQVGFQVYSGILKKGSGHFPAGEIQGIRDLCDL